MRHAISTEGIALCALLSQTVPIQPEPLQTKSARPDSRLDNRPNNRLIDPLIEEFKLEMEQQRPRLKPKTIHDAIYQIRRLIRLAEIQTLDQLQMRPILRAMELLKENDPSPVTLNHYIGSIAAFTEKLAETSLWRDPVLPHDPLAGLKRYSTARDRRIIRTAYSPAQFQQLFHTTLKSKKVKYGIEGVDRAHSYLCLLYTGMRKCEARLLTANECRLYDSDPRFELDCSITKNGYAHTARVGVDAVPYLRDYCRRRLGGAKLFRFPKHSCDDIRMLRPDLVDAGLAPHTILEANGRKVRRDQLDWHSFRVTFVTWLLEKGATVQEVMKAVGHRSEKMVMHYARLLEERRQSTPAKLSGLLTVPA